VLLMLATLVALLTSCVSGSPETTPGARQDRGCVSPPAGMKVDGYAGGRVFTFVDVDADGSWDENEPPLPDVPFGMYHQRPVRTGPDGFGKLFKFKPGCWCDCWSGEFVYVGIPAGYWATTATEVRLTGYDETYRFGFRQCEDAQMQGACQPVSFADPNLEVAIRKAIASAKPHLYADYGDTYQGDIYAYMLDEVTELYAGRQNIADLSGLEYCTHLRSLQLDFNNISDLSPLAGLTNLNYINLIGNQINDLSPLVHNMGLRNVFLSGNPLNDEAIRVYLPQLEQRGVIVR